MSAPTAGATPGDGVHGLPWREVTRTLRRFVAARVASPADADDVLQEVLLRLHRHAATVEDPRRVSGWIHQIARRAIADHHRARRATLPTAPDDMPEPAAHHGPLAASPPPDPAEPDGPEDGPAAAMAAVLAPFVDALPPPYRDALRLTELDGLTQADAARRLGISLPAMKSRVLRGRARLRASVEDCCAIALDARHRVVGCEPRPRPGGAPRCDGSDGR